MRKQDTLVYLCLILIFLLILCSLQKAGKPLIVNPENIIGKVNWTANELKQVLAVKTLNTTKEASYHVIRIRGSEKPHVHDRHDLVVFVLSGEGVVHFQKSKIKIKPGDVIEIPRGKIHWAQNTSPKGVEVYAVFTPPYDSVDQRDIK